MVKKGFNSSVYCHAESLPDRNKFHKPFFSLLCRIFVSVATIICIQFLTTVASYAQTEIQDANLAQYYFRQGEFDKAVTLYEKLYNKHPDNNDYYTGYYGTLIGLKNYDEAVKVAKKKLKKNPKELIYYIDIGNAYQKNGDTKSAKTQYELCLKNLYSDQMMLNKVATAFIADNNYDYAIATYNRGKKIFGDPTLYAYELADIYKRKGDIPSVISAYLDILESNPEQQAATQSNLQSLITEPKYSDELRKQIYLRLQKNPDNASFSELLIWYFIQKKDFESAFIQVKALDKRNKEDGGRVFQFAQSAFSEGQYDAAVTAYQYLVEGKGKQSGYYLPAKSGILQTLKTKITVANNYTPQDLMMLKKNYDLFITEFGKNAQTIPTLRDEANLEARFLHNLDSAIAILNDVMNINTGDRKLKAYCKLDLGDYNLMNNEIWEATLLYSQVDKDFKDDALGEEARFRNAKLSYYTGDFEWAQAQMDVLKGSTQELISNDAIALSVFITDNSGLDTTYAPMEMYARADLLIYQNRNGEAVAALDSLSALYPNSSLDDDILFAKARIYLQERKFDDAAKMFQQVDDNYSTELLADDATFQLAELYEHQLMNKEKAMELYKSILIKYPGSVYVIEARKRFRDLRGDNLN